MMFIERFSATRRRLVLHEARTRWCRIVKKSPPSESVVKKAKAVSDEK